MPSSKVTPLLLNDAQIEVVDYLIQGFTQQEIAAKMAEKRGVECVNVNRLIKTACETNDIANLEVLMYRLGQLNWYTEKLEEYKELA